MARYRIVFVLSYLAFATKERPTSLEEAEHLQSTSNKRLAALLAASNPAAGFVRPGQSRALSLGSALSRSAIASVERSSSVRLGEVATAGDGDALYDPASRDKRYGKNMAQYLVDLHDAKATFNFCGGMMFQLVLSEKLRSVLANVAKGDGEQPLVAPAHCQRMSGVPEYSKSADADSVLIFHGREVRQVEGAAGGMGMVMHLSHTEDDEEGWTPKEIAVYDGWNSDRGREWSIAPRESEAFRSKFGGQVVSLQHRCYLHYDAQNKLWLSAEDGCEGTPQGPSPLNKALSGMMGNILRAR